MRKWYLVRSPDIQDTRAYNINTTDIGNTVLQGAMNAVDNYDNQFFSCLDHTSSESLKRIMNQLIH